MIPPHMDHLTHFHYHEGSSLIPCDILVSKSIFFSSIPFHIWNGRNADRKKGKGKKELALIREPQTNAILAAPFALGSASCSNNKVKTYSSLHSSLILVNILLFNTSDYFDSRNVNSFYLLFLLFVLYYIVISTYKLSKIVYNFVCDVQNVI